MEKASRNLEAERTAQDVANTRSKNNRRVVKIYETNSLGEDVRAAMLQAYKIAQHHIQATDESVEEVERTEVEKLSCEKTLDNVELDIKKLEKELRKTRRAHEDGTIKDLMMVGHVEAITVISRGSRFPQATEYQRAARLKNGVVENNLILSSLISVLWK